MNAPSVFRYFAVGAPPSRRLTPFNPNSEVGVARRWRAISVFGKLGFSTAAARKGLETRDLVSYKAGADLRGRLRQLRHASGNRRSAAKATQAQPKTSPWRV